MSITRTEKDVRAYPSGPVFNNTIEGVPPKPGAIAASGSGWVWIAYTDPQAQGGTADTENNALNAVLDAWLGGQA